MYQIILTGNAPKEGVSICIRNVNASTSLLKFTGLATRPTSSASGSRYNCERGG